ncbi:glycosyltransferase family 1 protein [Nocardioides campestrisoli]|uniref:glycosyltransferase family 1 protein n=1 Tax=Nocardioides campestrisoli TaxID=2736757 RepID=UPI0015E640BB|nr:glycosyltransferase family 1 protein [Nocardioides campestrisoli]
MPPQPMRVLSVPSGHVYVRHLSEVEPDGSVLRLADEPVPGDVPAAQWWPPPVLDVRWVLDHQQAFDLAHLHFGFDSRSPRDLEAWVQTLRWCGKPLVYTVHDLRNPHHRDSATHAAQLDVLVPAADALITLTPGAAREISRRWGRTATVLPHPHVVPDALLDRPRPAREGFTVGLHLKSLRAGMEPLPVLEVLVKVLAPLPDATLQVDVHTDVMTPGMPRHDEVVAATLTELADDGLIDLRVHDYFSDDELWDYLSSLDLSVLPYRFGTHSGWLEACYDLGTPVAVPSCGYYREQRPCLPFVLDQDGLDVASLEEAVLRAYTERPRWRADAAVRRAERSALAREHARLYAAVLDR